MREVRYLCGGYGSHVRLYVRRIIREIGDLQPTRGGPPAWGLGDALTTPPRENKLF